jgi:hypothetical protein
MTTLTLHKLPEGFIVTSDEKPEIGELYIDDTNLIRRSVMGSGTYWANRNRYQKVIAQQDQIDFSALTEEEQKEIGWWDVEKLTSFYYGENRGTVENEDGFRKGFPLGFQKSQELLSDRRFTLEKVGELLQQIVRIIPEQELRKWTKESFVKHFAALQNCSWTIEVEMEEYVQEETGTELKWVGRRPKFTDGKLKVTKIL